MRQRDRLCVCVLGCMLSLDKKTPAQISEPHPSPDDYVPSKVFQTKKVKIDFSFSISCIALINTQPTFFFFFCLNIYLRLGSLGKRFQDLCANVHWGYSQVQLCGEWGVKDIGLGTGKIRI